MGPVNMPIRSSAYALWTPPVLRAAGSAQDLFRGSLRLVRLGIEFERGRIDAIAQTCRGGAIVKHMPEMRVALRAQNFGSPHEKAAVLLGGDAGGIDGLPKRRPACAGIELCI